MNKDAKKRAINKVLGLIDYFDLLRLEDLMSNDEYDWINDHILNTVSSLHNFENIDGRYDNFPEELEA